ncbi:MAG: hypothetical protein AAGA95_16175, partial [Pseudomonadota bacterium]
MIHPRSAMLAFALTSAGTSAGVLQVTSPGAGGAEVGEAQEFSTFELGDVWDMSNPEDVVSSESNQLLNESFSGGLFTATTTGNDPSFFVLFSGIMSTVFSINRGQQYPIDTSIYRYVTLRIRYLQPAPAPQSPHCIQVFFYDETAAGGDPFGGTTRQCADQDGSLMRDTDWNIVHIDLEADSPSGDPGGQAWSSFADVKALRFDPTDFANVDFELDWIRLVAADRSNADFVVQWNDAGAAPYAISAIAGGEEYLLGDGFSGTQGSVNLAQLPPDNYTIRVSGSGESADSPGDLAINAAPILNLTQPDVLGDVANRYSVVELGNPWGPLDASDVSATSDLSGVNYAGGSLNATTTGGDSGVLMNTPVAIDTAVYRMLTYTFEVSGERDIGAGSVTRVLWGRAGFQLTTSEDIIIQEGTNTYPIGDMRNVNVEAGPADQWVGSVDAFRFDPHEFPTPREVRLDSIVLAPLDTADPAFNIEWIAADPDDNATIRLFVDDDRIRSNGPPPTLIFDGLSEDSATSALWNGPQDVPSGEYFVLAEISDSYNTTFQYSTGPVLVGSTQTTSITITEPNGNNDVIPPVDEFSRDVLGDAWLMDDASDVLLARSVGLSGESINGGIYTAMTTTDDPSFMLLFPGDASGDGALAPIDSSRFRRLTAKVRVQASSTQLFSVNFFRDGLLGGGAFGTTSGVLVVPGDWRVITVDLPALSVGGLANWNDEPNWRVLRIDPTVEAGVMVEIDWIALLGDSSAQNQFAVNWQANELGNTVQGVNLVDQAGDVIPLVNGLPA